MMMIRDKTTLYYKLRNFGDKKVVSYQAKSEEMENFLKKIIVINFLNQHSKFVRKFVKV